MYRIILILIGFIILNGCKAKKSAIDKIITDEDVVKYISELEETNNVKLCEPVTHFYDSIIDLYDSITPKNWFIADFDGNGYKDLLLKVSIDDNSCFYNCILSFGGDSIKAVYTYDRDGTFYTPIVSNTFYGIRRHQLSVEYLYYNDLKEYIDSIKLAPFSEDTIVFFKNYLVEYNNAPVEYKIEEIKFMAGGCLGDCPVFTLSIKTDRTLEYNGQGNYFGDRNGRYKSIIGVEIYNKLYDILNYIDFPSLQDYYSASWTCDATYTLKITYDNGKVKEISDYGREGTLGLVAFYKEMFKLKENQNWVKKEN